MVAQALLRHRRSSDEKFIASGALSGLVAGNVRRTFDDPVPRASMVRTSEAPFGRSLNMAIGSCVTGRYTGQIIE